MVRHWLKTEVMIGRNRVGDGVGWQISGENDLRLGGDMGVFRGDPSSPLGTGYGGVSSSINRIYRVEFKSK